MRAQATGPVARGDRAAETEVYIPSDVHAAVAVGGRAVLAALVTEPDGSRLAYVAPEGGDAGSAAGAYSVTVGVPGAALVAQVATDAAGPPAPISEPVARETTEEALAAAAASPDAHVRANAGLASTLAGLLLGPSDPNTAGSS